MLAVKIVFWASLGLLLWTHVGYPIAAALAARVRRRRVVSSEIEPSVSVIVAAHNEADVIERRVRNLLELDYHADRIEVDPRSVFRTEHKENYCGSRTDYRTREEVDDRR